METLNVDFHFVLAFQLWGIGVVMSCQIVRAAEQNYGRPVSLEEACKYGWDHIRMKIKGDSWRVYVSRHIASLGSEEERDECRKIYRELRGQSPAKRRKRKPSKRKKGLNKQEYDALMEELRSPRVGDPEGLRAARLWLASSYHTGMRPSEWLGASLVIIENSEFLKVRNAKVVVWDFGSAGLAKQGRIRAHYRIIPVGHLPANIKEVLKAQMWAIEAVSRHTDGYTRYYDRVRQLIAKAARNLWPAEEKRPTLYSARHAFRDAFEARLLADGATTAETELLVSVVLGHGSRETKYAYGAEFDEEPLIAERKTAVNALLAQKNVLMSWAISQLD